MLSAWWLLTVRLAVKSLTVHRLRSLLTILGVVFGVASVIIMLAIGEGTKREALKRIEELGSTNIIVRSVEPANAMTGNQSGAIRYGLTKADVRRITTTIPTLTGSVVAREHRSDFRRGSNRVDGRLLGVMPEFQRLAGITLQAGRFISQLDNDRLAAVAVLGAKTAATLFPLNDPLGKSIRIGEDRYFTVIGVANAKGTVNPSGSAQSSQDYNRDVYVPFASDLSRFGEYVSFDRTGQQLPRIVEISQITLAVEDTDQVKGTADLVRSILLDAERLDEIEMVVPLELLEKAEATQRLFTLVLGSIASISLLVGGIGIMNIMLATVTERTREIGIRRALGATRRHIIWQFLIESVTLSSIGGLIGLLCGIMVSYALPLFLDLTTIVRAWAPILAFTISVLTGVIFGAYPARRAAFMNPIQALRHD